MSIGLEYEGTCILGVVFDPTRPELFVAERGGGATCNGQPIRVSQISELGKSLLVTGFGYDIAETGNNLDEFCRFTLQTQGVRRTGTAAIDLCYLASGRFDGFWESGLQPWDVAAGILVVREAGGMVSDLFGQDKIMETGTIIAANPSLHKALQDVLAKARK